MSSSTARVLCAALTVAVAASFAGSTFAVVVSTSRYWFNYRHTSNALSVYHALRRLGLPDSHIILMIAESHSCSFHNPFPGRVFSSDNDHSGDVQSSDLQVDFSGDAVTPEALLRILSGRHLSGTPAMQRLETTPYSRLLVYLTGHGGEGFLKFHDKETLSSADLSAALRVAESSGRFYEVLAVFDTCQASSFVDDLGSGTSTAGWRNALRSSLHDKTGLWDTLPHLFSSSSASSGTTDNSLRAVDAVGLLAISSSLVGESSYNAGFNFDVGLPVSDQFTRYLSEVLAEAFPGALSKTLAPSQRARGSQPTQSVLDPELAFRPNYALSNPYRSLLRTDTLLWQDTATAGRRFVSAIRRILASNNSGSTAIADGGANLSEIIVANAPRENADVPQSPSPIIVGVRLMTNYCNQTHPADAATSSWCTSLTRRAAFRHSARSQPCEYARDPSGKPRSQCMDARFHPSGPNDLYSPTAANPAVPALESRRIESSQRGAAQQQPGRRAQTVGVSSAPTLSRLLPGLYELGGGFRHGIASTVSARVDLVHPVRVPVLVASASTATVDASTRVAFEPQLPVASGCAGSDAQWAPRHVLERIPLFDFFGSTATVSLVT
jgi:hypothetical protein